MRRDLLPQNAAALEIRKQARARLQGMGYSERSLRTTNGLIHAVEQETGLSAGGDPHGLIERWLQSITEQPKPPYVGQIVPPRERNNMRGTYTPSAAYLANVERAKACQPRTTTMVSNAHHPGIFGP